VSVPELWSRADEEAADRLLAAVAGSDLVGALLAVEGADDAVADAVRADLDALATAVRSELASAGGQRALVATLVEGRGLRGAPDGYYHPDRSALSRVLATGHGMPILLSAVWMAVGRKAGVPVDGLGLPGHFIVRVAGALVDPFGGGTALDEEAAAALAHRGATGRALEPSWLVPVSVGALCERVLRNLQRSFDLSGDRRGLYRVTRLLARLRPDLPAERLREAALTEEFGAYELASTLYLDLAAAFEGTREAQAASIRAIELGMRSRTLN